MLFSPRTKNNKNKAFQSDKKEYSKFRSPKKEFDFDICEIHTIDITSFDKVEDVKKKFIVKNNFF